MAIPGSASKAEHSCRAHDPREIQRARVRSFDELEELDGVDVVFGLPGGAILPTYDPLFDSSKLRHVLVRHEQGAGHAAEGYAVAIGRVGVCIATSGPGATNLVTALMDANLDSIPMVAITGQVGASFIGTDAFQEADIVGATMPVTKHSFLITSADEIPARIAEAFYIASTGRPGPVLVDITEVSADRRSRLCVAAHPEVCPATGPAPSPTRAKFVRRLASSPRLSAPSCTWVVARFARMPAKRSAR